MARASALIATGRLEDARASLLDALELAQDGGPVPRVTVISACAAMEQLLGRREDAHRRLTRALDKLAAAPSKGAATLMVELALDAFYSSDFNGMANWAQRSVEASRAVGTASIEVTGTAMGAFAESLTPPVDEAQRLCDEASRMVDEQTDAEVAMALNGVTWLASAEFYLERFEDGTRHGRRGLEVARTSGQGDLVPALAQALANHLFSSGHPIEAGALLDDTTEAARLTDSAVGVAWSQLNRAYAAVFEGDLQTADEASAEAYELTKALEGSPVAAWAGAIRGRVILEHGDARQAAQTLTATGGTDGDNVPGAWRATWLEWMARCHLDLRDADGARRYAALARTRADEFGLNAAPAAACRAEARNLLAAGETAAGVVLALEAAERSEAYSNPIEAAHARVLAGQALAAMGDKGRAIAELERAVAVFEACKAYRLRAVPERELRKLGRGTHRRSRPSAGAGVSSLTGRELEVARMVLDRRTNPEIASELFLSVKTVETHMRNIFRKLDVSSRVEVARTLEGEADT
jgi:DNA-binding NarL/FixJ family response regulator